MDRDIAEEERQSRRRRYDLAFDPNGLGTIATRLRTYAENLPQNDPLRNRIQNRVSDYIAATNDYIDSSSMYRLEYERHYIHSLSSARDFESRILPIVNQRRLDRFDRSASPTQNDIIRRENLRELSIDPTRSIPAEMEPIRNPPPEAPIDELNRLRAQQGFRPIPRGAEHIWL